MIEEWFVHEKSMGSNGLFVKLNVITANTH